MGKARTAGARAAAVAAEAVGGAEEALTRPSHGLTAAEVQVLQWVAWGKQYREIAAIMETSVFMIQNHVTHILNKVGASTRSSAVRWGLQNGVIS